MIKRLLLLFIFSVGLIKAQSFTTGVVTLKDDLTLDLTTDDTTTTMILTGPADAWFAVGFGGSNMFGGVDVFRTDGANMVDASANGNALPAADTSQDWTLVSNTVSGSIRTITVTRANDTGDSNDYIFSNSVGSLDVIWAHGTTTNYGYHGGSNRGATTIGVTLSINDFDNLDFTLYPNPVSSKLILQLPETIDEAVASVYDISGRKVNETKVTSFNKDINVTHLTKGVYLVKVASLDKVGVKRIIKN